jgi:hypothetical protein
MTRSGRWVSRADLELLFARGTVAAMVQDFGVILEWIASRPEEPLSALQEALYPGFQLLSPFC